MMRACCSLRPTHDFRHPRELGLLAKLVERLLFVVKVNSKQSSKKSLGNVHGVVRLQVGDGAAASVAWRNFIDVLKLPTKFRSCPSPRTMEDLHLQDHDSTMMGFPERVWIFFNAASHLSFCKNVPEHCFFSFQISLRKPQDL